MTQYLVNVAYHAKNKNYVIINLVVTHAFVICKYVL